jgi:hypothetical protein
MVGGVLAEEECFGIEDWEGLGRACFGDSEILGLNNPESTLKLLAQDKLRLA